MRRARQLPSYRIGGWVIDKCPNSFAAQYAWTATAVDADGYQLQRLGFATKRAALAHAKQASDLPEMRLEDQRRFARMTSDQLRQQLLRGDLTPGQREIIGEELGKAEG